MHLVAFPLCERASQQFERLKSSYITDIRNLNPHSVKSRRFPTSTRIQSAYPTEWAYRYRTSLAVFRAQLQDKLGQRLETVDFSLLGLCICEYKYVGLRQGSTCAPSFHSKVFWTDPRSGWPRAQRRLSPVYYDDDPCLLLRCRVAWRYCRDIATRCTGQRCVHGWELTHHNIPPHNPRLAQTLATQCPFKYDSMVADWLYRSKMQQIANQNLAVSRNR